MQRNQSLTFTVSESQSKPEQDQVILSAPISSDGSVQNDSEMEEASPLPWSPRTQSVVSYMFDQGFKATSATDYMSEQVKIKEYLDIQFPTSEKNGKLEDESESLTEDVKNESNKRAYKSFSSRRKKKNKTESSPAPLKSLVYNEDGSDENYGQWLTAAMSFTGEADTSIKYAYLNAFFKSIEFRFLWPVNNVELKVAFDQHSQSISFYSDENIRLQIKIVNNKYLLINEAQWKAPWQEEDIRELIDLVNLLFKLDVRDKSGNNIFSAKFNPENYFTDNAEVQKLAKKYKSKYISFPHFILNHTEQLGGKHIAWIPMPKENHPHLCLRLEITAGVMANKGEKDYINFHSWVFSPSVFLKMGGYPDQMKLHYFRLQVFEHNSNAITTKFSKQIIDIWAQNSFKSGEIVDVQSGQYFNGNEAIQIADQMTDLLNLEDTYLCDSSRAHEWADTATDQIVFRVLKAMATGKTWYEDKIQFQLFSFFNETSGAPDIDTISQDADQYQQDLKSLRETSVVKLFKYFKEEEKSVPKEKKHLVDKEEKMPEGTQELFEEDMSRSVDLQYLCHTYFKTDISKDKESKLSLGKLAEAIYTEFRKNPKDKKIQTDLQRLYDMLRLPRRHRLPPDYRIESGDRTFYDRLKSLVFTQMQRKVRPRKTTVNTPIQASKLNLA